MTSAIGMAKGMNDVTRYDVTGHASVDPYEDGEYVLYADYATLQQQLADAREECERLRQAVMYQEGRASEFAVRAAAAEADAARYRFLRDVDQEDGYAVDLWNAAYEVLGAPLRPEIIDAEIDSAIATLQRDRQP